MYRVFSDSTVSSLTGTTARPRIETPSHPGSLSKEAKKKMEKRDKERERGVYSSSSKDIRRDKDRDRNRDRDRGKTKRWRGACTPRHPKTNSKIKTGIGIGIEIGTEVWLIKSAMYIYHHIDGRTRKFHPSVHDLQVMDLGIGFPCPFCNVVIDYFSPMPFVLINNPILCHFGSLW